MEFKSQICTTVEQSKRLLELGLKEDTADMWHYKDEYGWRCSPYTEILDETAYLEFGTPAWSLHRLLSLLPTEIKCDVENGLGIYLGSQNGVSYFGVLGYYSCENLYDAVILCIEDVIKEGYFNQDYLEEKK